MDIDKLIPKNLRLSAGQRFGSLMDIDKLIPLLTQAIERFVLVL